MMRLLSALFIIVSYFISRFQFGFIVTLMSLSWGVVSGAFAAPYILGLYCKGITKAAAYCGLISGLVIEILLFFALGPSRSPLAASLAILVPFIVVPAVSRFTPPPDKALLDKAFALGGGGLVSEGGSRGGRGLGPRCSWGMRRRPWPVSMGG
jgi:SSS family solute:Na+ symporter